MRYSDHVMQCAARTSMCRMQKVLHRFHNNANCKLHVHFYCGKKKTWQTSAYYLNTCNDNQ